MNRELELSRQELACAVETLAAAGDAGHDASGRPLNGTLRSGLQKLRRQWQLRYDTRAPKGEALTVRELRHAFADEGEVFPSDITAVVVTLTSDIHYDNDLTLEVAVHGKGGLEDSPLWHSEHKGEAHLLAAASVEEIGWVGPSFIRSLFSQELRATFANLGTPISFNPGWTTGVEIDPLDECQDVLCFPERG